ncbi:hypothetical protein SteCoe_34953 [Stentor coeruleus]|uniref:UBX domain-containing protein n=1 Tax=Stentor coeruleus TaxID=5963 RepID=A0A1R2ATF3_9CILI|nr:hypothetical protein SteCoe_34953 [Stentor coeruleus]
MAEEIPLYKIKSSLLPDVNIDYSLLGYKSPAQKDIFAYEIDLLARYTERQREIDALKQLQISRHLEHDRSKRKSVGEEMKKKFQESHKNIEIRNQKMQSSDEKQRKINQLMKMCPGIKDTNEANFYLESQNFNVEAARDFYTSCTGRSNVAVNNSINIKIVLPEKTEFQHTFDSSSLMWSMLEQIHGRLRQKKNFKVILKSTNKEITLEEMTRKTFANYGITSNTVLVIQYI